MNERLLRFFVAVYEEQNLSRAAEKCFVSQPNISNGLKQLEEIMSKQLFKRHKRGVEILDDAHYLYTVAKRILFELNAIPNMFEHSDLKTKIIIGVADSLPMGFKSEFFKQMTSLLGNVEWDVRPIGRDCQINILVREWKFDEHIFLPIYKEKYVLCIPDNHFLLAKDIIDIRDLDGEAFIHCPPCDAHQQNLSILNNFGGKWNTVANCQSKNEVLSLLISGLGITFLPEYFAKEWTGFEIKKNSGPQTYREVGISYDRKSLNIEKIAKLIEYISHEKPNFIK